jgi:ferrochelatase
VAANRSCYRHQCVVSARGIAERVGLRDSEWTMTFQSRLTNGWVKPYTDVVLVELAKKGIKRLLVFCPAFVADCLETLEEIQGRAREEFIAAGGEDLALVPSLNAEPMWADAVVQLATRQCGWLAQS